MQRHERPVASNGCPITALFTKCPALYIQFGSLGKRSWAWARVTMLTKLKYAGVNTEELLHNYKQLIRVMLDYCTVVWHSSLSDQQLRLLERCQAVCLRVVLGDNFISYEAALEMTGLQKLSDRRQSRCLAYGLKSIKHPDNKRCFMKIQT